MKPLSSIFFTAISILLEGSIVTAQISGSPECANVAKRASKLLLDNTLNLE